MRRRFMILASLALGLMVGCSEAHIAPNDISGVWDVQLRHDATGTKTDTEDVATTLAIALLSADSTAKRLSIVQGYNVTHIGVFGGDSEAVAPGLQVRDLPPFAIAIDDGDSVTVVLNPDLDHGALHLKGHRTASTITGRWYHTADAGQHGQFDMQRRSTRR